MDNILSKNNPQELLRKMQNNFANIFHNQKYLTWIESVKSALENNQPVLPMAETDSGSFFDIFIDFHRGAFDPTDFEKLNTNLQNFCNLCGDIESLTDMWPTLEEEPSEDIKKKLHSKLVELFKTIPSEIEFNNWIRQSLENFSAKY